jgi:hypothetical protein
MTKVCQCGKEFEPTNNRQKYCSERCGWNYHGKKHRSDLRTKEKKNCLKCGQIFYTSDARKKYCSSQCKISFNNDARLHPNKGVEGDCEVCGKKYVVFRNPTKRTCSNRCAKFKCKYDGNRLKALARDSFTCQSCGKSKNAQLHVHHKDGTGQTNNPNHELDNLVTLCVLCHHKAHKLMKVLSDNSKLLEIC